ncbi:MAG: hypothetical protein H0V81_00830 [Solirubrobacterales bacterium]|nr:hypothetical protein [Solirubrobacterales bacterium]
MVDQPVDPGSASCVRHALGGFASPTPCPLSSGGTVDLDTASLADGAHQVRLEVYDATGSNKATEGPWSITVDNTPPAVGEVDVRGTAREGEILSCAAPVAGQSPTVSFQWIRANADGSGLTEIPGATGAVYALTGQDVSRKVLCRVTGRDGGGSSDRTSTLTGGPFANGAVVESKPAEPAPAPPTTGTGTGGAAGQDGTNGADGAAGANDSSTSTTTNATTSSTTTKSSSTSNDSANGNVAAAASAAVAAVPQCTNSSLTLFGSVASIRRSYNRSRLRLSGRLVGADGRPSVGQVLKIVQTVVRSGSVQRKTVGTVRTTADGRFGTTAPPGPSRALQLIEEGCGAVGRVITQRVRGAIQARTTTRRVRNGKTARIRGRVLGGYVGRGIPVELQVKVGRRWRDVKHAMTNSRGEYKVGYRFTRTYVRYTYSFRVVSRAGGSWPFMAAKSRTVKVRVN